MDSTLWYKDAVFYEVYVRAFYDSNGDGHGDLRGLTQKLDYLQDLGVNCLWLLPIYPSPLKDDGYDIENYYDVHPSYGNLDDFKTLLDSAHERGIRVIMDLVLNHTSDKHPWFRAARANRKSIFHNYYVWSNNGRKYKDARVIFLDTEKSNWAWDEQAQRFYWHRFYSSQPDLNYDNIEVQKEIMKIMSFWLDLGVDGFRADAVPYLYEREYTNCENLPQTHGFLKKIRRYINDNYPGRILLAEANQWPEDVLPYFGDGHDEFHMGFHFPVMPRIYMAIRKADRTPLVWILNRTPPLSESCQWCIFLRNHDELTLEMVTDDEREWMWNQFAPDQRMRLNLGIRRRLAPLLNNDPRLINLANSFLFTLPGSPIIYYGDEIGMGDNIWLPDRNGVRTPMQWSDDVNAGFSEAPVQTIYTPVIDDEAFGPQRINVDAQRNTTDGLWHTLRRMIATRRQHRAFGWGNFSWIDCQNNSVAIYTRRFRHDKLVIVNNLSETNQHVTVPVKSGTYTSASELLTGDFFSIPDGQLNLDVGPYQYLWLKLGK